MYADILAEELAILVGDSRHELHIVPAWSHAFNLVKDWNVVERINEKGGKKCLGRLSITLPTGVPIFPYGTAYGQEIVVRSWKKALGPNSEGSVVYR